MSFAPYAFSSTAFSPYSFGGLEQTSVEPTLRISVPPRDFSGAVGGGYLSALAHTDFGAIVLPQTFSGVAENADFSGVVSAMSGYMAGIKLFSVTPDAGEFSGDVAIIPVSSVPASPGIVVDTRLFAQTDPVRSFSSNY